MRALHLLLFLGTLALASSAAAQPLVVDKVEPPNWWVGMKWHRVQLMLYGEDLHGLSARFEDERIRVAAVHTVPNPAYAFVDVDLPDDLPPGDYTLEITKGAQRVTLNYPLLARETSGPRHQGFGVEDVVYLVTPDRFANGDPSNDRVEGILDEYDPSQHHLRHGGDLQGLIDHLDYLRDLGVTALWLNPVLENNIPYSYHGYQATNLYRIDPRFGANADYKRLVEEAHRRGLKIIFDHVNNHIGVRHPWIGNLPTETWLNGSVEDHLVNKHYKMAASDPHADPYSDELLRTFWFVDSMPDLNQRDPFLANYLIQNTLWWIEYTGLDGIREDTYPYPDQAYLARWAQAILDEYPAFNIVGEIWENEPAYVALFQTESRLPRDFETNLPAVMDFPLAEALRAYLDGTGSLEAVYKVFAQDFLYTDTDNLLTFFDNHDMTRGIFVADGQTEKVKLALALLFTVRGIPQLLYGTEINMRGGASHVELRADFPGGFPGHLRSAFTEAGRTAEENAVFDYTRKLLQLRKAHPALTHGKMIHYPPSYRGNLYTYLRRHDEETILVVLNGYEDERRVDLSEAAHWLSDGSRFLNLMTGEYLEPDLSQGLAVGGWTALILQVVE